MLEFCVRHRTEPATDWSLVRLRTNLIRSGGVRYQVFFSTICSFWRLQRSTAADVPLRDGDVLLIPKKANYVTVSGQVFNPTAISYRPGRSARWYLNQSGGLTQLADKEGVFVIRADGAVIAAKNNSGWWAG